MKKICEALWEKGPFKILLNVSINIFDPILLKIAQIVCIIVRINSNIMEKRALLKFWFIFFSFMQLSQHLGPFKILVNIFGLHHQVHIFCPILLKLAQISCIISDETYEGCSK